MKNFLKGFKEKYPTWSMPTKIGIWFGVIGMFLTVLGLVLQINPFNRSLENNFGNWSISENSEGYNCPPQYVLELTTQNEILYEEGVKIKLNNVKLILPSKQEAWIDNYTTDKTYHIGTCNDDFSNCCINPRYKYQNRYRECFVFESTGDDLRRELFLSKYFNDSRVCYNIINGSQEIVIGFINFLDKFGRK